MDTETKHRTVLVFGTGLPLADRISYYLEHYAEEHNKAVTVIQATGDVTSMESIQEQVWGLYTSDKGSQRPTLVINAHYSDMYARLQTAPDYAFRTNTHTAANIAIAARGANIPMVQISTDQVFRGNKGPYLITDEPMPINMYGISMVYAERAVATLYPMELRGRELPTGASILRLSWIYGPNTGTTLAGGDDKAPMFNDLFFNPTFVGEAAFLIARNIIESPQSLSQPIIHCSSKTEPISWWQLFQDAGKHPQANQTPNDVRIGQRMGLIPTQGWVLPQDYQKGFKEYMHEIEHDKFVSYW